MTETQNTPTDNYFKIYGFARPVKAVRSPAAQARRAAFAALIAEDEAERKATAARATTAIRYTAAQYAAVAR